MTSIQELKELTSLTVINIVDNEIDGMSSPCSCMAPVPNSSIEKDTRVATYTQEFVTRLNEDKSLDMDNICHGAHGLSLLLIAEYKDRHGSSEKIVKQYLLFDGGPSPSIWRDNAEKCKIPYKEISHIVLSHYHIDHSNGLRSAVPEICKARENDVTVDLHPAKVATRGLKVRGKIYPMKPDNPLPSEFQSMGANVEINENAHVVNECFYVSGEIKRQTSFETGLPGHFNQFHDAKYGKQWVPDEDIKDERYVACKLKGRGVVVFSACSHAGIVNVCLDASENLKSEITAAVGGFHLAGSGVENRIDETIAALKKMKPDLLLAGHCTGWKAKAALAKELPYIFNPLVVGGKYRFNSL